MRRTIDGLQKALWRERWGIITLVYGTAALAAYGWLVLRTLS